MEISRQYRIVQGIICAAIGLLFSATLLHADVTGTILGTVSDPSGAAVVGADVTLRNPNNGLIRKTKSDATGGFEFLLVPVGEGYILEGSAGGFEKTVQSGIKLLVNQAYRVDFHLQVGAVTQSISVSAAAVQVESTSTQLGDVIEDQKMTSLPLNGRSYIDLLGLQAGVAPIKTGTMGSYDPGTVSGGLANGTISVSGSREDSNSFMVNGGDVNDSMQNGASVVPVLDSIQEFRVLTGSFDAEYGRFSGGVINVVTKSGTNTFHGDVFEFLRNEKLDSRNFFDVDATNPVTGQQEPGTAIGEFRQNQFGGTIGGRIIRDRVFFFSDYQGTRQVVGVSSGVVNVPSTLEQSGNFSDVGTTGYSPLTGIVRGCTAAQENGHCMNDVLTQRLGYTVTNGEPYWVAECTSQAEAMAGMCVFPNQVIPKSALSPAASGTMKFIPTPNGNLSGTPYYSTAAFKSSLRDDKFGQRIDFNSQRTGNWMAYYHFDDANLVNPYAGGNVPGFAGISPSRAQQANLGNTRNFGANKVNDWRLNYNRFALASDKSELPPASVSQFGFVEGGLGIIPAAPYFQSMPVIGLNNIGLTLGNLQPYVQANNTFQIKDNLSIISGRHTLKFGVAGEDFELNEKFTTFPNGYFSFSGTETGNDFADYLIGAPSGFVQASPPAMDGRSKYLGLYGQDSFKLRPNLTLNYGLRWEFSQPWSDTQNRIQAWVPGEQSKIYPDSPTGWDFPGDPGIPSSLAPTRYDNFAPRIGFAYSPDSSGGLAGKLFGGPHMTSIRASFGIFYTAYAQFQNAYEAGDAPFAIFWSSPNQVYFEEPYEGRQGVDPGQRFPYIAPTKGATGPADLALWSSFQPISGTEGAFATNNVLPYVEDINFTIQRQLSSSMIVTLGFAGTRGHHLLTEAIPNPGNQALCLQVRQALGPANGCGPFGEDQIYNLPNGQTVNGTRPYSVTSGRLLNQGTLDFGDVTLINTAGNSNYNALEATFEKRVGAVRLLAAYTWSKAIDDSSCYYCSGAGGAGSDILNPYDGRLNKAISAFDLTQNFVISYSYSLPFQRLTSSSSGPVHQLLDGWQFSGITRFTTGFPVSLDESSDQALCGGCTDMPDYNGQPIQIFNPRSSNSHRYFSTGQFIEDSLGQLGTANRRFFYGPGINNWDMALHKLTRVTEGTTVEFRAEFFNIFNHAQFNTPGGNFLSPAFGNVTTARDPRIGQVALRLNF